MKTYYRYLVGVAAIVVVLALSVEAGADWDQKNLDNKAIQLSEYVPTPAGPPLTAETEPNNNCAAADALLVTIEGAINPFGDEDWFSFSANAGDCITLATDSQNGSSTDTQIFLYNSASCSDPNAWLIWDDDAGPGLFSLIENYEIAVTGTYYLRVKHFSAFLTGDYQLSLSNEPCELPPANDFCASAEVIPCGGSVEGTTDLAGNDLDDPLSICIPFVQSGPDVFYQVCVPASHMLTATLAPDDFDPGLWFVTDCADNNTCVAGVDAGLTNVTETLNWTNTSDSTVCLIIVVDSFSSSHHGDFTLNTDCQLVAPTATESSSWGSVKQMWR